MNYFYSNFLNGYPDQLRHLLFIPIALLIILYLIGIPLTYFIYEQGREGHEYKNWNDRLSVIFLIWLKTPVHIIQLLIIIFRIMFK